MVKHGSKLNIVQIKNLAFKMTANTLSIKNIQIDVVKRKY